MNRSQAPGEPQATALPIETAPVVQQPAPAEPQRRRSPACADAGSRAVASSGARNFPPATGSPVGDRARSGAPDRQAARAFSGSLEARAQRGRGRSEQARRGEEAARLLESLGIRRKRPGGWFVSAPMRTCGRASRPGRGLAKVFPGMKKLPAVVTDIPSQRNGKVYYRLQIGTTSQAHSEVLCQRMKAIGQSCVVVDLAGARRGSWDERQPVGL